jgi:hypothetical protein
VKDSLYTAIAKFPNDETTVIKYFCGVCWGKIKKDDPRKIIKNEWYRLSKYYNKGSGYINEGDIESIIDYPIDTLRKYMIESLSKRRTSYWGYFMDLCQERQNG